MVEFRTRTWSARGIPEGMVLNPPNDEGDASVDEIPDLVEQRVSELKPLTGLSAVSLRVLLQRGIQDPAAIEEFLNPKLGGITDPFLIKDMGKAIDRLVVARKESHFVRVYGDYDVDGTCGAALLYKVFESMGVSTSVRQPDRFKDGYGLNVGAIEQAHQDGVHLLVTVDCGITNHEAVDRANELGLDVIVVDHHQVDPKKGIPDAVAVVNPQREDCESHLRQLCGCGLGFYVGIALRARGREEGWFEGGQEPNLKEHLDLVVIATAADMVPLKGDNRILVRHGMKILRQTKKPGVKALMQVAGLASREVSPGHLGFALGPRINASGRLANANTAFELLVCEDALKAARLAEELERLNRERSDLQNKIWDDVKQKVQEGINNGKYRSGIVVADKGWHEGVVGIVASKITETFRKPAVVMSIREDVAKGSVRSYAGKNVLQALRDCSEHLAGFGGHKFAAGLSLLPENVETFVEAFDQAIESQIIDDPDPPLLIEGEVDLAELDYRTLEELESLAPFGPGNPEPVFEVKASVLSYRVLKDRHLKLNLGWGENAIEAIWFNAAESPNVMEKMDDPTPARFAGVPEINRFRGRVTPVLRVKDWKSSVRP